LVEERGGKKREGGRGVGIGKKKKERLLTTRGTLIDTVSLIVTK